MHFQHFDDKFKTNLVKEVKNMMKKSIMVGLVGLIITVLVLGSFSNVAAKKATAWDKDISNSGFEHGLAVEIDGEEYYFKGPGSIAGEVDVPGHTWKQAGPNKVLGKHYNVGPTPTVSSMTPWWATNEDYGAQLYHVDGIIDVPPDELSEARENKLKKKGYVHVHEFVDGNGNELEDYVIYLKHTAVRKFHFNGGPMAPGSNHMVTPGVDYNFIPNW
jgi:hypothetical protein